MLSSQIQFYIWLVMGVVFLILELIVPTNFILLCFGLGMLAASFAALLHVPIWGQIPLGLMVAVVSIMFSKKHFQKAEDKGGAFGSVGLVGHVGLVTKAIDPVQGGMVRIYGETWRAVTRDHTVIPENSQVVIVDIEGTKLVVGAMHESPAEENKD